jgi:hypothetical protein
MLDRLSYRANLLNIALGSTNGFPLGLEVRMRSRGIRFKVIDTPRLCDDLEEEGNDNCYLDLA